MRSDCLDDQMIAALLDAELEPAAEAALHAHLIECDACLERVTALGFGLQDEARLDQLPAAPAAVEAWARAMVAPPAPDPRPPLWQIAIRRLADGIEALAGSLQPMPALAVTVRSARPDQSAPLRYQLEAHGIQFELCLTPVDLRRTALSVALSQPPHGGCRIELEREGALVSSVAVDQRDARVAELDAGQYLLRIMLSRSSAIELPIRLEAQSLAPAS